MSPNAGRIFFPLPEIVLSAFQPGESIDRKKEIISCCFFRFGILDFP